MLSELYTFSWESKHQACEEVKYTPENLQLCFRGFRLIKQIKINPGATQITSTPNKRVSRTPSYKIDWLPSQMAPVCLSSVIGRDSSPAPPPPQVISRHTRFSSAHLQRCRLSWADVHTIIQPFHGSWGTSTAAWNHRRKPQTCGGKQSSWSWLFRVSQDANVARRP